MTKYYYKLAEMTRGKIRMKMKIRVRNPVFKRVCGRKRGGKISEMHKNESRFLERYVQQRTLLMSYDRKECPFF